ncbi:MAG: hypothetical protein KGI54_03100 [Pseudomonadota bacterium]|nr:hypothetical protein [Pseudomonadota bacterium]
MTRQNPDAQLRHQRLIDFAFRETTHFFAFLVFALLIGIILSLVYGSLPSLKQFGFHFFISPDRDPASNNFSAVVPIIGTPVTSCIAMIIGIPVSFGTALLPTEISPGWLKRPLGMDTHHTWCAYPNPLYPHPIKSCTREFRRSAQCNCRQSHHE